MIVIATAGMKRWMTSSARQEIQISGLKIENSASSALIDLVCDVAVQLDSKLNINHDSRAFKALLIKSPGATTKGMSFSSFISDDHEREAFEAQLLSARTTSACGVGTFRTTLVDSLRNRLRVDIFFVKVEMDVDGSHYLLGIRESGEGDRLDTPYTPLEHRKRVSRARKGTPSTCERADLEDGASSAQSTASNQLLCPQLLITSMDAQFRSLLVCLSSWNVSIDRRACCSFHAYVMEANTLLAKLREAPCDTSFPNLDLNSMQCHECGIIEAAMSDRVCGFCDSHKPEASQTMQL
eukprot:TRINITY_DN5373_c0_g3_i1.p1 TRINITY_DN5373_c0_g3~~TRINITY_DN5373_c0_g3_i1.p1  ORF type:complete len:296 (-),score=24.21 TRINITY_DN5373_c0_g3_i1:202-1089(-)